MFHVSRIFGRELAAKKDLARLAALVLINRISKVREDFLGLFLKLSFGDPGQGLAINLSVKAIDIEDQRCRRLCAARTRKRLGSQEFWLFICDAGRYQHVHARTVRLREGQLIAPRRQPFVKLLHCSTLREESNGIPIDPFDHAAYGCAYARDRQTPFLENLLFFLHPGQVSGLAVGYSSFFARGGVDRIERVGRLMGFAIISVVVDLD